MSSLSPVKAILHSPEIVRQERLRELEQLIEHGLQTYVDVGLALKEIKDSELYRKTHNTFKQYCDDRWGFSDSRARQLIAASNVARQIMAEQGKEAMPKNEAQARAIISARRL